jgi:hypothetical protein
MRVTDQKCMDGRMECEVMGYDVVQGEKMMVYAQCAENLQMK